MPDSDEKKSMPSWRQEGEEPDYRFTLANERTFLAWIRTALGVLASGVLLHQFATKLEPSNLVSLIASVLCLLAAFLSFLAYRHWKANEIAMRHKVALPQTKSMEIVATVILGVCVAFGALLLGATLWH